jgi:hypothetical protein
MGSTGLAHAGQQVTLDPLLVFIVLREHRTETTKPWHLQP